MAEAADGDRAVKGRLDKNSKGGGITPLPTLKGRRECK